MDRRKLPPDILKEMLYAFESMGAVVYEPKIMILKNIFTVFTHKGNHGVELCSDCLEKLKWLLKECHLENLEAEMDIE